MRLKHRSIATGFSLMISTTVVGVGWTVAQTGPQKATVAGVIGAGVSVNGVPATLAKDQVLALGATVTAAAGTKVFLNQQWDTEQGRCIYWTIINGASWPVGSPDPVPCPIINKNLSLSSAAATPGVTTIADVHRQQAPPAPVTSGGSVVSTAQAITVKSLDLRLSDELDTLVRQQQPPPDTSVAQRESMIGKVLAAQATHPLVCRGGGDMHFTYTPFSNLSPQPQIWITFSRASAGVGSQWENMAVMQPGQCAWLDRAVAAGEPETIALLNVNQFSIQWQRGQVTGIGSDFSHVGALQDGGKYQAFDVYNNGNGYFVVARIGQSR